jgi:phospholipid transport system substrate-binding protein
MPRAALLGGALLLCAIGRVLAATPPTADGPLAVTRAVLERSNTIVRGSEDRKQKLLALGDLLRDFLDTEALARLAAGKHLEGRSPEETAEFLRLFRELFIRTYVQRLLLFDAPDFAYGQEHVTGDTATVGTEIITPKDRFAVDYTFRRTPNGWRATDIRVEDVSLASNFRAQFDSALAKDSFQGLLERLRKKVGGAEESS